MIGGIDPATLFTLVCGVAVVAFLYAPIGHAGASGYIAVMGLLGIAPALIKPNALTLNLLVASLGAWQFWRAGHFRWRAFWPFALPAVPCAFIGGWLHLPTRYFLLLVGAVLLVSAVALLLHPPVEGETRLPSLPLALCVGAALGLLAGLSGTGGGIFLTPLLVFARWTPIKTASAVSALFILLNSASGLGGHYLAAKSLPNLALPLGIAVIAAGGFGAWLGARHLPHAAIKRLLALVLAIVGAKMLLTA
jgi:uncharacterized membrane protein YfcA